MKRNAVIEAIALLILSCGGIFEGIRLVHESDPHAVSDPLGPALFVLILSIGLFGIGVWHLGTAYGKDLPVLEAEPHRGKKMQVIGMALVFALYIPLIELAGYLIASFLFFMTELRLAGARSWMTNTILSLCITACFYLVFEKYCSIVFPRGILF